MSMPGMSLTGYRALVTGAAGGIGSAIARDLDALGAAVLIVDVNLERAKEVADSLGSGEALGVELTDPDSIRRLVESALAGGHVDVLVNCAGWDRVERFVDSTPDMWDRLIALNLRAPIQLTHSLLPGMLERSWGRIVNISSDAARVGSSGESVYSACKAGILGFTKTVARETARQGVTVNAVCPGPTDTPFLREVEERSPNLMQALRKSIPIGRLGRPEDVAGVVAFLCSPRAEFITGQTLSVSGGLTMV
jgi:2-hydroxycyclohexanecarboxyl-CoA dehydrogenase